MEQPNISIVIPVMNEQENILPLYNRIKAVMAKLKKSYEIIYVDDGSTDNTSKRVEQLHSKDKWVKLIQFRKNFGKSAAYATGFEHSSGQFIITMDGDLQDDPSDIPNLLSKLDAGYDFVSGWKQRKYRWYNLKNIPSKVFNRLTSMLTGIKLHDIDCPFKAFKREVLNEIKVYGELHRYVPVLAYKAGFKVGEVKVKNLKRGFGRSKFGAGRLVKGSLDLITVFFLTKYMKRPLHFFGSGGLIISVTGIILGIYMIIQRFLLGILVVKTWIALLSVLLIILGIQFMSVGLIGEMLTYTYGKNNSGYSIRKIIK